MGAVLELREDIEIGNTPEPKELSDLILRLIGNIDGASTIHEPVTRIIFNGRNIIDYFNNSGQLYKLPHPLNLPNTLKNVIDVSKNSDTHPPDFTLFIRRVVAVTDGALVTSEVVRRISLGGETYIDAYKTSKQVRVRVPATRLPKTFREIIELYQQHGYSISGYAPSASHF